MEGREEIMPVPWIKIEVILPDKTEVVAIARLLKMRDIDTVVGKLIRLWGWADQQTVGGDCVEVTGEYIDRLVFCRGFAKALRSVGWLKGEDGALVLPNFDRHNGETAKARAESARRMAKSRAAKEQRNGNREGAESATDVTGTWGNGAEDVTGFVAEKVQRKAQTEGEEEFNSNKRGGGRIPQSIGERPPGCSSPPPPPVFSDCLKGEDGTLLPEFVAFVNWVKSLRPGWDVGRLSRREQQSAGKTFLGLERPVSELERLAVAEYLAHEPEHGSKFDYPPDRELFLTIFQEVIQKAVAWFRRTGRKTPAEKEEGRKRAARAKLRNAEATTRRLAGQFRHSPEELISELNALRLEHGAQALTESELEKIRKGDYEL